MKAILWKCRRTWRCRAWRRWTGCASSPSTRASSRRTKTLKPYFLKNSFQQRIKDTASQGFQDSIFTETVIFRQVGPPMGVPGSKVDSFCEGLTLDIRGRYRAAPSAFGRLPFEQQSKVD